MLERDVRELGGDLDGDLAPEPRRLEHVRLVDGRDALLPPAREAEREPDDARDLVLAVLERVDGAALAVDDLAEARLAEVEPARQLAHEHARRRPRGARASAATPRRGQGRRARGAGSRRGRGPCGGRAGPARAASSPSGRPTSARRRRRAGSRRPSRTRRAWRAAADRRPRRWRCRRCAARRRRARGRSARRRPRGRSAALAHHLGADSVTRQKDDRGLHRCLPSMA